jgi:Domain of unknown function (DUF4232)
MVHRRANIPALAATVAAGLLAGCGVSGPVTAGPSSPTPDSSRSPAAAASAPASAGAAGTAVLSLASSEQVPFTGDVVVLTAQAAAWPGSARWLRLANVTVSFGDGESGTASQSCSGQNPPAARGLSVSHRYLRAGPFTAHLTAASVCGQAGQPDLSWVIAAMRVLPAAPPASTAWPRCTPGQVRIAARGAGVGLGHVGVLLTVHNTGGVSCRLAGYPGLQLLGQGGGPLPTSVHAAATGTYLFPPVALHRVALRPGGYAAVELEYEDNPWGAQADEPYATACPTASQARVTLPGSMASSVIPASMMAPCGGDVWISPFIPGRNWIMLP